MGVLRGLKLKIDFLDTREQDLPAVSWKFNFKNILILGFSANLLETSQACSRDHLGSILRPEF